jgi:hypothetical protein
MPEAPGSKIPGGTRQEAPVVRQETSERPGMLAVKYGSPRHTEQNG